MISENQIDDVQRATVYDNSGDKIGKAGQVYLDDATGSPSWITVNTGLFGTSESFVPLENARFDGSDRVDVGYSKSQVKDAPRVAADGHLEVSEEAELYRYYGLSEGTTTTGGADYGTTGGAGYATTGTTTETRTDTTTGTADFDQTSGGAANLGVDRDRDRDVVGGGVDRDRDRATVGHDTSGPTTDDAMTRSEERLNVGTEKVQTGRARLRKYVTTEQQTVTVPVSREEVRIEREPITEGNRDSALSGPDISEEEHEVTLTEERPVVSKEAVPVERVRLDKETVTEQEQVSDEVRKEEIDVDGGTETTSRRD
ncbi:MAG TPA: PRC and DUF2382 domain-containing protein [Actinomycetales bacterium]|nr:PRC and DUF2382 domain-containing protein [Actinomycetales bacterium]